MQKAGGNIEIVFACLGVMLFSLYCFFLYLLSSHIQQEGLFPKGNGHQTIIHF